MNLIEFTNTDKLIEKNSSKRIFTGHTHGFWDTIVCFFFTLAMTIATYSVWFFLCLWLKKPKYHKFVYRRGTKNKINEIELDPALKEAEFTLEENEIPEILIMSSKTNFILFTNKNIYWSLKTSRKVFEINVITGKKDITEATKISLSKSGMKMACEVTINDDMIGVFSDIDTGSSRDEIQTLMNAIARDINEYNKISVDNDN